MATKKATGYWLVKQEPATYSWDDFVREGSTEWTGVRNFQARNNLRQMSVGDRVLFYHSGQDKAVVGIAEVTKAAYPDPTTNEGDWVAVDLRPVAPLKRPIPLTTIRAEADLGDIPLLRQSRLSVMPLTSEEFEAILALANKSQESPMSKRETRT